MNNDIEAIYPLSPAQEGVLFHSISSPEMGLYFHQSVWDLDAEVDLSALRSAWQRTIDRHPILRTAFLWEGRDRPLQVVRRHVEACWREMDWDQDSGARGMGFDELLKADRDEGFKLKKAPLMRLTVVRGRRRNRLIWSRHHIIIDGWSSALLLKEVKVCYEAIRRNEELKLPQPRPFQDYIAWLQGQDEAAADAFWGRRLKGFSEPTSISGAAVRRLDDAEDPITVEEIYLPAGTTRRLQANVRKNRLTLNVALQGAWAILLTRYSGNEDVVFGATLAGRSAPIPGIESMLGLFINTLPVRTSVNEESRLIDWFRELHSIQVETQQYEYSHLIKVKACSSVPAKLALFETILVFENFGGAGEVLSGKDDVETLKLELLERSNYPLVFKVIPGDCLGIEVYYHRNRFEPATIKRMVQHLQVLLTDMGEGTLDRFVSDVHILSETERHQLLIEWNQTGFDYPRESCVHELFAAEVAERSHSIAAIYEDSHLSYAELNRRANRLAWYLRARGIVAGSVVGVLLEPGPELLLGLLGILKAGAAYLPLDPHYPARRLQFMLQDTCAAALVTSEPLVRITRILERDDEASSGVPRPAAPPPYLICLDRERPSLSAEPALEPVGTAVAGGPAYIMYTSGTTGKPRGVAIAHRAIVRLVRGANYVELNSDQVMLSYAPVSFDASTFEIWGCLLNGGRLVIGPRGAQSLEALGGVLQRYGVTTLWLTAGLFHQMVDSHLDCLAQVRQLLAGGDVLSASHSRMALERRPGIRLINGYGPTENTTFTCCYTATRSYQIDGSVPIGRPISNTWVYVGDRRLQPSPVGAPGQMLLGGDGLATAYIGRPELTAARFIPDGFGGEPGARVYQTGDVAKFGPNGDIEFLGRIDNQVKIRGFRIELGEVEAALREQPGVREAVVAAGTEAGGNKRLVAYIVGEDWLTTSDLRAALRKKLPDYMVPAVIVSLDRLPLTANGKVDRNALPDPEPESPRSGLESDLPRGLVEQGLVEIWKEVLGLRRVGVNESFFELGGHSLMATRVISRVRSMFKADLGLNVLFDNPTVRALAGEIEQNMLAYETGSVPPLTRRSNRERAVPSYAQERMWFLDLIDTSGGAYNIGFGMKLEGPLNEAALNHAIAEIVRRHEVLRTGFTSAEGLEQVIDQSQWGTLPIVDLAGFDAAEQHVVVNELCKEEWRRRFDLEQGGLFRLSLIRKGADGALAIGAIHHIVSDGWSMGLLLRETGVLYKACHRGDKSPLRELELQYADYAAWQRDWLKDGTLRSGLDFWRKTLSGSRVLEVPSDRPRTASASRLAAYQSLLVGNEVLQAVKQMNAKTGATLFVSMLAAFTALLHRYTGEQDIAIGTPIAGRREVETEDLIGLFVNTMVIRTGLEPAVTCRELLGRVRDGALAGYVHQDVPFEKIVEELQPERDIDHTPLFQVMVVLLNTPSVSIDLDGLTLTAMGAEAGTAKFDLTLTVIETIEGLTTSIEYRSDLYDSVTILRMLGHLERVLRDFSSAPARRVRDIPLFAEHETAQMLIEWNATGSPSRTVGFIHEEIEGQTSRTPDAIAIVFENDQLSYFEMDRRANQLARYLRAGGLGPESVVGILMERSVEMVIGLCGILKCGAAYLPLDPAYPGQRLAFMVEDAGLRDILTIASLESIVPGYSGGKINLDRDWSRVGCHSDAPVDSGATGENIAYVIYTSGSTGNPKGVMVPHGGIADRLGWIQDRYALNQSDRVLLKTPYSFDISITELFWPLAVGATVVVAKSGGHQDAEYLAELIAEQSVTTAQFVPSLLDLFLTEDRLERCKPLERVFTIGEALNNDLVKRYFEKIRATLHNLYGPTEAAVEVSYWDCEPENDDPAVPIGRPVANAGIYILDRQMEPLCQGMPGEIHLGGIGLARGYISRPDLTAEKFVPNPFAMQVPACLYKTGDLGRYMTDGRIEFLGRIDHQVKIRGNRVETGEIEAVMRGHAAVGEAVVMARQSRRGDTDLVAYVLANGAGQLSLDDLRDLLRRKLPAYMIPSSFVVLDALPLTSNGKIDRKALHAIDIVRPVPVARRLRPRNQVETAIASIWEAVLKIDQISVTDNFFDLGGHSLAMAQVFGHLRNALRRDIVLTDLFRFPTIRSLAGHLGAEPSETSSFAQKYESAEMKRQAMRRSRRLKRAGETEARREDFQAV